MSWQRSIESRQWLPLPCSRSAAKGSPRSLSGLLPFLRPYRRQIALAGVFLVLAAVTTLVFPVALRGLIDGGLAAGDKGAQADGPARRTSWRCSRVAVALGVFSAARFYMVSWLGERVTADLRNAVYAHVLRAKPGVLRDHADRRGAVAPDDRHDAGADRGRLLARAWGCATR